MKKDKLWLNRLLLLLSIALSPIYARADYTATPVPATTWGTWDAWGTSLAWFGTAFGNQYSVAEAIFGTNQFNFNGTTLPGLGFNFARYNTGACGTATVNGQSMVYYAFLPEYEVQGYWVNPASTDPASSSWDWTVDANQRTLLLNAQALGANRFELFANSPMWWMCKDLCPAGNGSGSATANLDPTNYDEFAIEMATIASYFKTNWGLTFTTVEPFNEPVSSWWTTNGSALQEGCYFANSSQPAVIADLRTELNNRGLNSMPISSPDDNQFDQTYNTWNSYSATTKSQVGQINSHAYQGTGGNQAGIYSEATAAGKTLYVSEYGDNDITGMTMASIITYEISTLHPTGWTYWQALDADGKDKNWGMINASDSALTIGPVEPKYYVMAQYSRHIRQGMTIISSGDANSLAAYDPVAQKLVIVTVNSGAAQTITYNLSNFTNVSGPLNSWTTVPAAAIYYVESTNLPLAGKTFSSAFAANSVQTFELSLAPAAIAVAAASASPNPAYPGQLVTISATVTATNPVASVTVNASAIGGSASQVLVSNGAGSYTNSVTVGASIAPGSQTLTVNASDTLGNTASPFPFALNIAPSIAVTAASASPNPAYPGQLVTISVSLTNINPVASVTVNASAIGGSASQVLVSNGAGSYTNSVTVGASIGPGIQTLTVNASDTLGNTASPFPFTLDIAVVTVTWVGAANANWSSAGNWSGIHAPPANGDTPAFGVQGPGGLTLNNDLSATNTFMGLTFNAAAPPFILNGNTFTNTGGWADNSLNLETINLPVVFNGTASVSVGVGGTLLLNGVLSQQGTSGLTKNGLGTVTLTGEASGANTYAGTTAINAGTLKLDFNTGGSTPAANIISSSSPLNLGGGTLLINGAAAGGTSQTFASTSLAAGGNTISLINNGTAPALALKAVTASLGATLNLSTNGTITTTTLGGAAMGVLGSGVGANSTAGYATYGLYDWATTDTAGGTAGTSPATVIGLSGVTGGYVANSFPGTGQGANCDLTANDTVGGNTGTTTVRFNTPSANTININGKWLVVSAILVTPNMGANNATIWSGNGTTAGGQWFADYSSANAQNEYVWQNNTTGYFINNGTLVNGRGSSPGTATLTYIQSGPGTVVMGTGTGSSGGFYSGQSCLNGGCTVVTADICLGVPATAAAAVLNGGTLVGNATMALDNGGVNPRPISLAGNGGGLAATAGNTMTIDGVVSGTAPLTIGIPASSANGNTVGLLPGSGAGTANPVAVNASGTLLLTTNDSYTGNTIIASGTLQLGAGGSINNSPNIIVGAGTTYDVSLISGYTLNAGQNLLGSGTVNGSVIASSGSGIYGGTDGTYGTNAFSNNLILATGAAADFDLGTSGTGSNDEIVVNGNLTLDGTAIHLKAPGTLAILASGNYTLFSSPNPITVNGSLSLVWDVPPTNSSWASITNTGNAIVLKIAPPVVTPPPLAAFVALTPTNIFVTQSVVFTNTSTGSITNSAWNFGDGNTTNLNGTSVTNNVSDTYLNLGTNLVILTASGLGGSSAATNYVVVLPKPTLNQPTLLGGEFIFSGMNGPAGQTYRILTTTNLALPVSGWTPVATNVVGTDGSYGFTNVPVTNNAGFFQIVSP